MTGIIRGCYHGDKPESRLTACLDSKMRAFVCLFSREERPGRLSSLWVPQRALVSRAGLECSAERIVVLSLVRILQSGGWNLKSFVRASRSWESASHTHIHTQTPLRTVWIRN